MAEALVSPVLEHLLSIMARELEREVRLVVGVENAVDQLTSNLTAIKAVLDDAEKRQVMDATVNDWLGKLKDVAYDIEDVLDDWEAAIISSQSKPGYEQDLKKTERKACCFFRSSCFSCKQVGLRRDIAKKIQELKDRLDRIAKDKERYNFVSTKGNPPIERPVMTPTIDIKEVKGREEDKDELVKGLLSEPRDGDGPNLHVLSIVGMGGIGKTTLAQFAYNHDNIETHFNKKMWVCVSDPFDEIKIAETILESILGHAPQVRQLQNLLEEIKETIEGKKFLLVLDDVWEKNSEKWDKLKRCLEFGLSGSKVLVTTREENIALVMGCSNDDMLKVEELSDEECWLIIKEIAFHRSDMQHNNLEKIGREISKKCRGLPLAAKVLGGILRCRRTREGWKSILESRMWKIEDVQKYVFAPLSLSYNDLSPALKRCFCYCAIFPKDYEIKKQALIELWMAQGYLKEGESDDLEMNGEIFFQDLAMRCFFQNFKYDDNQRSTTCKMHDIVHDFAQMVGQNECLGVEDDSQAESIIGSLSSKVRHLSLDYSNTTSSFNSFDGTKKLRSLLIDRGSRLTTEELSRLISESTHVRSLRVRSGSFEEIPPSIRKLVHLRWLDLSHNSTLDLLPETLCELHSLQTIDLTFCFRLEQLPFGIGKLINLRHLHNRRGPTRLPKGIAELTCLRTLEEVDVGFDDEDAFSLGDLKNLNQLRGMLELGNLGAYNSHVDEAKHAKLKKKKGITELALCFRRGEERCTPTNEELLLEALEPSRNLEILEICFYGGTTFPGWIISLTNLRSISLLDNESCEQLPSLGKLPSLDTLIFGGMSGVKIVGVELLGIETEIGESEGEIPVSSSSSSSCSSSSSPVVAAFPKLTTLEFLRMESWEEWDDYYDGTTKPPASIMPSLHSLRIIKCRRLKALPDYILQNTNLQSLVIDEGDLLEERYNEEKGEDWSKISHISHVTIFDPPASDDESPSAADEYPSDDADSDHRRQGKELDFPLSGVQFAVEIILNGIG